MTREELRELDHQVAMALGWTDLGLFNGDLWGRSPDGFQSRVPPFSAVIAAAWPLLEKLAEDPHTHVEVSNSLVPQGWNCWIGGFIRVNAPTAPLAIVRGVLMLHRAKEMAEGEEGRG